MIEFYDLLPNLFYIPANIQDLYVQLQQRLIYSIKLRKYCSNLAICSFRRLSLCLDEKTAMY